MDQATRISTEIEKLNAEAEYQAGNQTRAIILNISNINRQIAELQKQLADNRKALQAVSYTPISAADILGK